MSHRFGRNRRRKLEAEAARLRFAHVLDAGLLNNMERQCAELRETIDRIERLVGPHFAALPPKTLRTNAGAVRTAWNVQRVRAHVNRPDLASDNTPVTAPSIETLTAYLLETNAEAVDGCVHLRLQYAGDGGVRSTYMLTPQALREMPLRPLVEEMAPRMLTALRKAPHGDQPNT